MARKAKHDQRALPNTGWICERCQLGLCEECIDVLRSAFSGEPLCRCKRQSHGGEPADKQIVDPATQTVWGPGLRVTVEGEVLDGGYEYGGVDHG